MSLEPCPFCTQEEVGIVERCLQFSDRILVRVFVECGECGARGKVWEDHIPYDEIEDHWNGWVKYRDTACSNRE